MPRAVVEVARRDKVAGILMFLDTKEDAEAIAIEMRRQGQRVEVRQWNDPTADGADDPPVRVAG